MQTTTAAAAPAEIAEALRIHHTAIAGAASKVVGVGVWANDADDILQDVRVAIIERMQRGTLRLDSPASWFGRVAQAAAIDARRGAQGRHGVTNAPRGTRLELAELPDELSGPSADAAVQVVGDLHGKLAHDRLARQVLETKLRLIRAGERDSDVAVAAELGIGRRTVAAKLAEMAAIGR